MTSLKFSYVPLILVSLFAAFDCFAQTTLINKTFKTLVDVNVSAYRQTENNHIDKVIRQKPEIHLKKSETKPTDTIKPSRTLYVNNFGTKYFIASSAIPLKKRDFYFHSNEIAMNGCEYGLTNHFSVGDGLGIPGWYVNFKLGASLNRYIHLNAQTFTLFFLYVMPFTYASTNITVGDHRNNITVGYGVLFMLTEYLEKSALKISGSVHYYKNLYIMTENYVILNMSANHPYYYLGLHGLRYIHNKNAFNFGALFIQEIDYPIPYFSFSRYLNK